MEKSPSVLIIVLILALVLASYLACLLYGFIVVLEREKSDLIRAREAVLRQYEELREEAELQYKRYREIDAEYRMLTTYVDWSLENKSTPSISALKDWLALDLTDQLNFNEDFNCRDFSILLSIKARHKHWDMGIIELRAVINETGNTWKHALNFIMTSEGLVYLEPQTDTVWWLPDHKEIEPGMTFRYEGFPKWDTDLVAVTDVDIIVEG